MIANRRRAAGPVLVALLTAIFYMEAIDHAKSSLLGDYSVGHDGPLDLWTRFPKELDDDTSAVFALLNENQHPSNCHERKYFLWAPLNWGIGSDLHTIGIALGFAMQYNRTLVYHPKSDWIYTSSDVCNDVSTPDCFFRPLSSCQWLADAQAGQTFSAFDMGSSEWGDEKFVFLDLDNEKKLLERERDFIPHILDWPTRTVPWWRSQTTRFIVRPLPSLLAWTQDYFSENLHRYPRWPDWNPRRHPPPDRATCIHVRHGDKIAEMQLHPLEDYLTAASDAALQMDAPHDVFLTTDDRDLIQYIERGHYDHYGFTFYYTSYDRPAEAISPMATAKLIGKGQFGRISLANLILGVHPSCKAFVQTTGSNWNRLINEIRKTDRERQDAPWIDLEPGEWRQ